MTNTYPHLTPLHAKALECTNALAHRNIAVDRPRVNGAFPSCRRRAPHARGALQPQGAPPTCRLRRPAHPPMNSAGASASGAEPVLVDLSDVRKISFGENNVPVAVGALRNREVLRPRSSGRGGVLSWFGWPRWRANSSVDEVMRRKSSEANANLGIRSTSHTGRIQIHTGIRGQPRKASDEKLSCLRCFPCFGPRTPPAEARSAARSARRLSNQSFDELGQHQTFT